MRDPLACRYEAIDGALSNLKVKGGVEHRVGHPDGKMDRQRAGMDFVMMLGPVLIGAQFLDPLIEPAGRDSRYLVQWQPKHRG